MKQKETNPPESLHESQSSFPAITRGEVVIGTLVGIDDKGQPLADYHDNPCKKPLSALTTLSVSKQHIGRQVALLFSNGDPQKPVIMGLIHSPLTEMLDTYEMTPQKHDVQDNEQKTGTTESDAVIDGERIVLEGKEEIVLRCGDASITLTKAGKILIRGKYLLNRSEGVNRIMGGSVQVN